MTRRRRPDRERISEAATLFLLAILVFAPRSNMDPNLPRQVPIPPGPLPTGSASPAEQKVSALAFDLVIGMLGSIFLIIGATGFYIFFKNKNRKRREHQMQRQQEPIPLEMISLPARSEETLPPYELPTAASSHESRSNDDKRWESMSSDR